MKACIASMLVAAIIAAPAQAELSPFVIPKGAYTVEPADVEPGTRGSDNGSIYNNLHLAEKPQGFYRIPNNDDGNGPGSGKFVGDDLHMTGNTFTGFQWLFGDPGTGSHTSTLIFANNTANDGVAPRSDLLEFTYGGFTYSAAFQVTGLPEGMPGNPCRCWRVTVSLPALVAASDDIWVGLSSNSDTAQAPGLGLLGTSLPPAIGSSHNLHWQTSATGTSIFTVPNGGSFRMAVLPEPAAAGLLALGSVWVLRRRASH